MRLGGGGGVLLHTLALHEVVSKTGSLTEMATGPLGAQHVDSV